MAGLPHHAIGFRYRQKDSDFWDIPFDRKLYTFVLTMNNTFTLSTKPDLKFTLSGFYQNKAIQGIFDLPVREIWMRPCAILSQREKHN